MATIVNTLSRVDLRREYRGLYRTSAATVTVVDVPVFRFLMLDGQGDPAGSPAFGEAADALIELSGALRSALRWSVGVEYGPLPLEGLVWSDDGSSNPASWRWTLMVRQPDSVDEALLVGARAALARRSALRGLAGEARLEDWHEGLAVQLLHIGPYAAMGETVRRLHGYIGEHGCRPHGLHHEIYLGDPRRVAPERLRTILRQPIQIGG